LASISIPFPSIDPFSRIDQSTSRSEIVIVLKLELVLDFQTVKRKTGDSANEAFAIPALRWVKRYLKLPVNPRTQAVARWRKVV
jgi:hypothetical protein